MIIHLFKPKSYISSVYDLNVEALASDGYKVLLCDIDNTLVAFDEKYVSEKAKAFFERCHQSSIQVLLCSNNTKERVGIFASSANLEYISFFCKPFKPNYKKMFKKYNVNASQVACVGDQICTDILGGNRMKIHSIFVDRFVNFDSDHTKFSRILERYVLNYLTARKVFKRGEYYGYKM